ncbi:hypothetical protein [Devosia sp.]|uniref:hypothetical protein n=1 Tax=Devosia sp. TaxID=1871048 RepID=UPI0025F3C34A|nr:hypothetical protein [Devosia sp.]MCR6633461.1 hypothetical protein [Devosia sp.]
MATVSKVLNSDLNRPFALFAILLCLPFALAGGAAAIFFVVMLFSGTVTAEPRSLLLLLPAILGGACVRLAGVLTRDLLLPSPLLQIDSAGILDRRLGCGLISWGNVSKIISLDPQQAGFLVEVHTPVNANFTRMRAGTLGIIWRLPPSTVYVAMQQAMGPHVATSDLLSIAREHGVPTSTLRISKITGRSIPV